MRPYLSPSLLGSFLYATLMFLNESVGENLSAGL